ncbi:transketolase [Acutalibacter sp. 1XD8-33]|uniref:transketolase family protein n=1 Tax=Acutalibacter sp. 1XD8-33 TaxID=2320081 RepID=UPI000EA29A56|nr:transketolase C-terminal domain-containing protein [Acutalibacter sp. 1XD8-33]RKJ41990.1 transketolase [Acutalibacter sp. 1XD8-33]
MKNTAANIRMLSKLGQRGAFFGIALPEIAERQKNVKLLTADLALLSGMDRYEKKYPDQFLNVGIAEQNMIGIAAGLAMEGYCVYASTYAAFIAVRSLEHIRQHLSHMRCNVKIVGTSAGVVAAKSGISHWATEDLAFMRALPNLTVLSAADSLEAVKMAEYAAETEGPMYIRLSGGQNCPVVYQEDYDFVPGRLAEIKKGSQIALIATGLMVAEAWKAADLLEEQGLSTAVYNMHTIKPLDCAGLQKIFSDYQLIATVEEHTVLGGMGSAVAEYKAGFAKGPRQIFIGFQDSFAEAGSQRYVWQQKGLTDVQIAERVRQEWGQVT